MFELLGVASAREREALCDELYRETAAHFRQIRLVEIQKQEQRARAQGREFRTDELAADLWDALPVRLPSRAHAEVVFRLARLGLHGAIRLPESEADAAALKARLDTRLAANRERAQRLACSRASDERRVTDLAGLLERWLVHGRPRGEKRAESSRPAPTNEAC